MRRYVKEGDGILYDRKLRRVIDVEVCVRIGDFYYVNRDEHLILIYVDDVEGEL